MTKREALQRAVSKLNEVESDTNIACKHAKEAFFDISVLSVHTEHGPDQFKFDQYVIDSLCEALSFTRRVLEELEEEP